MKVKDHNKFRLFDYENQINPYTYQLGDILTKNEDGINIGVVIQTFNDGDIRTDMWGMCSESEVSMSNISEIEMYRPNLIEEIVTI
jgi:hypothetical protein